MTEHELKLLGFTKESSEYGLNVDDEDVAYYYVYTVADGLEFISADSADVKNDEWWIEVFNTDPEVRFTEFGEVQALINLLESRKVL